MAPTGVNSANPVALPEQRVEYAVTSMVSWAWVMDAHSMAARKRVERSMVNIWCLQFTENVQVHLK